jgi:crotonobetainyl-CoA:carnitine CoA-transferase CaiB-like acyl-CoA transferase
MTRSALAGIRVLDLTRLLPGGICTLTLADLGAEVVKVEAPGGGDYARAREPHYESAEPSSSSASYIALNRNKRSLEIDLKDDAGRAAFHELAEAADVVVESFRPGVLDRLGVGYEALREANPRLVYCALTGWGQQGPFAGRAGHDINYLASMGLLSLTGTAAETPTIAPIQIADTAGAMLAAVSILAALNARASTGEGQYLDVSLAHSALYTYGMGVGAALGPWPVPPREEALFSGGVVCYQAYRASDGWVALGALEERFWAAWCRGVGREDLLGSRYEPAGSPAHAAVAETFAGRTCAEWEAFGREHDCCLNAVVGLREALGSDPVLAREMVIEAEQPGIAGPIRTMGSPLKLSGTPVDPTRHPAPALDEHDDLRRWSE